MNDIIDQLESDVDDLAVRDDVTIDDICLIFTKLDGLIRRAKEAKAQAEMFAVIFLPQHGGRMVIGEMEYWVGPNKKVKCRNIKRAVEAIYVATGGDYDAFADCLSANALKIGACRKVLGENFDTYFETIIEQDLEHKPIKALQSVNTRFLK